MSQRWHGLYLCKKKCVCGSRRIPVSLDILYLYLLNLATLTGKHVEKGINGGNRAHLFEVCWRERLEGNVVFWPSSERTAMTFMSVTALSWRAVGTQVAVPWSPLGCLWVVPNGHTLAPPSHHYERDNRIPRKERLREVIFLEKSTRLTQVMYQATNVLFPHHLNSLLYPFLIHMFISNKWSHSLSLKCFLILT